MKKTQLLKKCISITGVAILLSIVLTACNKEQLLLSAEDYELDAESNTTIKGIGIGDNAESFLEAYGEYDMEVSVNGESYQSLPTDEISFDEPIQIILPTFFIDKTPVTISQICEENEIPRTDLLPLLSSEEYLNEHTVTYNYLIFGWQNGMITEIRSEYMDYNLDASYYEEISDTFNYELGTDQSSNNSDSDTDPDN